MIMTVMTTTAPIAPPMIYPNDPLSAVFVTPCWEQEELVVPLIKTTLYGI